MGPARPIDTAQQLMMALMVVGIAGAALVMHKERAQRLSAPEEARLAGSQVSES